MALIRRKRRIRILLWDIWDAISPVDWFTSIIEDWDCKEGKPSPSFEGKLVKMVTKRAAANYLRWHRNKHPVYEYGVPYGSCHVGPWPRHLRGAGWGSFKQKIQASNRFAGNQRAYRAWLRITHNGWRLQDECPVCGAEFTLAEQREFEALLAAFFRHRTIPDEGEDVALGQSSIGANLKADRPQS